MMHYPFWPVTIAALLAASAWVFGRLKQKAQPLRLELADKGEALLACEDASESARRVARLYLDTAFSFRGHLLLAHLIVPFVAMVHLAQQIKKPSDYPSPKHERNPQVQTLLDEMSSLNMRITFANHPILCASVFASMFVWIGSAIFLVAVIRGVIPSRIPSDEITERVNSAYALIPAFRRGHHGTAHFGA